MALFCDFENIALGVKEARYADFDIGKVLERLLVKGNIVVRKAYCDWERYAKFKAAMHEASFELIEIPHVRQSGKNSADIRMVVDALDLCYSKTHIDVFALLTGDSDFSPLVGKLKENDKRVIGCGVKSSTSQLLVSSCDEFLYYDDLVRVAEQKKKKKPTRKKAGAKKSDPKAEAIEMLTAIVESLDADYDPVWGSLVKQTMRRVHPDFREDRYGYKGFAEFLKDAEKRGHIRLDYDEARGNFKIHLKD